MKDDFLKCCKCGKHATSKITTSGLSVVHIRTLAVCNDCRMSVELDMMTAIMTGNHSWFKKVYLK